MDIPIKGEMADDFLKREFEFEDCEECGGDERDHTVTFLLGNLFAYCRTEIYDNGGTTCDRYTVIIDGDCVFGMSEDPLSPQGFNQFCGQMSEFLDLPSSNSLRSGKKVTLKEVPERVAEAVRQRCKEV